MLLWDDNDGGDESGAAGLFGHATEPHLARAGA
jgi:hypothetical protein